MAPAAFLVLHLPPGLSPRYQVRNLPHQQYLHFSGYHLEAQWNDIERRDIQDLWISAYFLDLDSSEEHYLPEGH